MQRPAIALVMIDRVNDRLDLVVPALEIRLQVFLGEFSGPAFLRHVVSFSNLEACGILQRVSR